MKVNLNHMSKEEEEYVLEILNREIKPSLAVQGTHCYGELTVLSANEKHLWTVFTDLSKHGFPVMFINESRRSNEFDALRSGEPGWILVRTMSEEQDIKDWMQALDLVRRKPMDY